MIESVYADRVLIEKFTPETKNAQGYIMPTDFDEPILAGKVVYIGDEVKKTAVGDIVVFNQYDHMEIKLEGDLLVIAREETLICKFKKTDG